MVNITVTMVIDPWRDLAFSYAPEGTRRAVEALFALDAALGGVLRTTREPLVGQMRLAWWREALERLDAGAPPAEPVLQALASEVLPRGVAGGELRDMVDGWEPLLGELGPDAIADHARLRGRLLFEIAARMIDAAAGDPVADAGEGWALADLSGNLSDAGAGTLAREPAATALARARGARWSRNGRPLGALSLIAQRRLSGPIPPVFVVRLARFRLTGR